VSASENAAGRYQQLASLRTTYLNRARDCAELTIPSLMPRDGHGPANDLPTPFQGMGARGVNNLASKLLLALLPPNQPFFRLMLDDYTLQQLTGKDDARAEVEKGLNQIERAVQTRVETTAVRPSAFEALKQLLVCGNVLVFIQPEGGFKVFRLDRYVVKRAPDGELLEIIIHEKVAPAALPEEFVRHLDSGRNRRKSVQDTLDIYTWVRRDGEMFHIHQEVQGKVVPETEGSYPANKSPFMALRWAKIDGEDYGRGHVEEYIGDLRSLEGLSQAIVEGSAAAAKVLILVNPNGVTDEETIASAPNLAVRSGVADDVSVLQLQKFADFKVAAETISKLEMRLAQAFLLTAAIQRQAERVTAEEIRLMAGELEDALGGVYSILSQEFQLPMVRRLMFQMEREGALPQLPEGSVKPAIVAGMAALGRGHDLQRLMTFRQMVGEGLFASVVKPEAFVQMIGTSLAIPLDGLIKSTEELAQERAQAQQAQLIEKLGPEAMRGAAQAQQQEAADGSQAAA
jgi:hypothetical protein